LEIDKGANQMKTLMITVPDGWKCGDCLKCPYRTCGCDRDIGGCPLANAKEAVEVNPENNHIVGSCYGVTKVDGQPVQLFAVKKEEGR